MDISLNFTTVIGSYEWQGKAAAHISGMISNLKVEVIDPVMVKGKPKEEDFNKLDLMVEKTYKKHVTAGIA